VGSLLPRLALVLVIAPICFVGDGLRDALDPAGRSNVKPRKRRARPSRLARAAERVPLPEIPWYRVRSTVVMPLRPVLAAATAARLGAKAVLERRAKRRRGGAWAVVEVLLVFGVIAAVAAGIYAWQVNPAHSPWRIAGTAVQNVSRAVGAQTEVSVAVSPRSARNLFAASNDSLERTIRVYSSRDGGRPWSKSLGPALSSDCARGDPSVAVGPSGREYVAFIVSNDCVEFDPNPYLVVASRGAPRGKWLVRRVAPPTDYLWDDGFGDEIGYGGYTAVAAAGGAAHPLWIDTRDLNGRKQEVFGATLKVR
jgi:hypothetical protein